MQIRGGRAGAGDAMRCDAIAHITIMPGQKHLDIIQEGS